MISTDDLKRIEAYAATFDPSLLSHLLFLHSPSRDNDGMTPGGTVAPGGSNVGGARHGRGQLKHQL